MHKEHFLSFRVRGALIALMFMKDPAFRSGASCRRLAGLTGLRPQIMRDILIDLRQNGFISYGSHSAGTFSINDNLRGKTLGDLVRLMDRQLHIGNNSLKDPCLVESTAFKNLFIKERSLCETFSRFLDDIPLMEMVLYCQPTQRIKQRVPFDGPVDSVNQPLNIYPGATLNPEIGL